MVKPGNMEWRVDYAGAWAMRGSGVDCEGSDKVSMDEKKALATTCLSIVARASRVLVVCNRIVIKLGINLSI